MNESHRQLTDNAGEYVAAAAKASPGIAVAATAGAGIDWNIWVLVTTFVFTVLQIAYLLWKWRRDLKAEKKDA